MAFALLISLLAAGVTGSLTTVLAEPQRSQQLHSPAARHATPHAPRAVKGSAASPIRVGAGPNCDHDNVTAALFEAAGNGPGMDTIHLANDIAYTDVNLPIASNDLEIIGGFTSCSDGDPGTTTVITADERAGQTVRTSGTDTDYTLILRNLELRGAGMNANGGVMLIEGSYLVALDNVLITDGQATRGGGIYIDGGDNATLLASGFDDGVVISGNIADEGGGGVYCTGAGSIRMDLGAISNNTARGNGSTAAENAGGGVALYNGCTMETTAGGLFQGIFSNTLESPAVTPSAGGGGVAVRSGASFTARGTPEHAALITQNVSASRGGGVYVSGSGSQAILRDAWVTDNQATNSGGGIYVAVGSVTMSRVRAGDACHSYQRCSRLSANSVLSGGVERGGAIEVTGDGEASLLRTFIEQNNAPVGSLASVGSNSVLTLRDAVIAGNFGSPELVQVESLGKLNIQWSTIAFNALDDVVFWLDPGSLPTELSLYTSIVWQPGVNLLSSGSGAVLAGDCVLAAELTGFSELTRTTTEVPGFFDAGDGDYRVRLDGAPVDYCDTSAVPNTVDMLALARPEDTAKGDRHGRYDLGAFEWRTEFDRIFDDSFE